MRWLFYINSPWVATVLTTLKIVDKSNGVLSAENVCLIKECPKRKAAVATSVLQKYDSKHVKQGTEETKEVL